MTKINFNNISILALILTPLLLLNGCASKQTEQESEAELYQASQELMQKGKYHIAVLRQELFEQRYPFSPYAEKNQIDLIFSRYKNQELNEAVVLADRFLKLNPDHSEVHYVWYIKALAIYDLSRSNRSFLTGTDVTLRDTSQAEEAFELFGSFLQNFPDSVYAPDARLRRIDIRNRLAAYDVKVAEFYMERAAWVAAANRANKVLNDFPGSPHIVTALEILADSYQAMGQTELSEKARQEHHRISAL